MSARFHELVNSVRHLFDINPKELTFTLGDYVYQIVRGEGKEGTWLENVLVKKPYDYSFSAKPFKPVKIEDIRTPSFLGYRLVDAARFEWMVFGTQLPGKLDGLYSFTFLYSTPDTFQHSISEEKELSPEPTSIVLPSWGTW